MLSKEKAAGKAAKAAAKAAAEAAAKAAAEAAVKAAAEAARLAAELEDSFEPKLVEETQGDTPNFQYKLAAADIELLARHYRLTYGRHDKFDVVGSKGQLDELLDGYKGNARRGVLCLLVHVPPFHWAAMLVWEKKVVYADSLEYRMPDAYKEALLERPELHLRNVSWLQQKDGHNCGFWALMNAEAIRRQIHDCGPSSNRFPCVLPSISPQWHEEHFQDLRVDMAAKVEASTSGVDRPVVQRRVEPSILLPPSSQIAGAAHLQEKAASETSTQAPPAMEEPASRSVTRKLEANKEKKKEEPKTLAPSTGKSSSASAGSLLSRAKAQKRKSGVSGEPENVEKRRRIEADHDDALHATNAHAARGLSPDDPVPPSLESGQAYVLKCKGCGFECKDEPDFRRHVDSEHPDDAALNKCMMCEMRLSSRAEVFRHVREVHCERELFRCPHCDYRTNRHSTLEQHIHRKHAGSQRRQGDKLRCPKCRKEYKLLGSFKKHVSKCR